MSSGRPKKIKSPKELYVHFEEYKKWSIENPMIERVLSIKDGILHSKPLLIPLTFKGFKVYLKTNNIMSNIDDYAANTNGAYVEFSSIIRDIKEECYVHKFNGASVGLFKENIISRELGLTDKKGVDHNVKPKMIFLDDEDL